MLDIKLTKPLNDLQAKLFETLRQRAQNPRRWIDEIAEVLCKSKHAIYKKIQGETNLSFDEVVILASHYGLHLDPLIRPGTVLSFEFPYQNGSRHYTDYLSHVHAQIQTARTLPDVEIWHTGMELPFLHDHLFPDLVAFRFFIHSQTVWADSMHQHKQFDLSESRLDEQLPKLLGGILKAYYEFKTIEIWNSIMLDTTLNQIRYVLQSGMFATPEDALTLCNTLDDFMTHMELMAEYGCKFIPGEKVGAKFELYHNEIAHALNVLLLKSSEVDILYLGFANPQFISSKNSTATENTACWLNILRSNATPIGKESRKERLAFFASMHKKIMRSRVEIEAIMRLQEI